VVIGGDGPGVLPPETERVVTSGPMAGRLEGEPEKTLQDARFVIGDYITCAILAPNADGEVVGPPLPVMGGRMRAFGGPSPRENGFGGRGGGFGGAGPRGGMRGGAGFRGMAEGVPSGEWRRGERIPEPARGGYGRGPPRRGPY